MPQINVDGINVNFVESGKGNPVVFLHSGGGSGAQWKGVVKSLGGRWRSITMDHYNHGGTDPWPGAPEERTHDAEAELVRAVIGHAGAPVHLVGHSFGGSIALRVAIRDSGKLRSLTLVEPNASSVYLGAGEDPDIAMIRIFSERFLELEKAGKLEKAIQEFMDGFNAPGTWDAMPAEMKEKQLANRLCYVSGMHCNLNEVTTPDDCRTITLKSLVIHGDRTPSYYRRVSELVAELMPNSRLEVLPGAGHMSPLSHPLQIAEILAAHLARVENATG